MTRRPPLVRLALVVVCLVSAGSLAGCGRGPSTLSVATAGDGGIIKIGALYPRTGPQALGGNEEEHGVELAAQWANDHAGVGGLRIQLVTADAPRAEAVDDAIQGLRARGVSVIVGTHGSTMSAAAADVAARDHLLVWETGAVGQIDEPAMAGAGRSFVRLAPMGGNLGRSAMDFIQDQWAPAAHAPANLRYAVAFVDDAYGRSVALGATDEIKSRGQNLVGSFGYDPSTKSFDELAQTIKAAKPDVLFVTAYIDDGVALRRATVAAHIPLLTSIGTSSSYCHPEFGRELGADAVGLFASDKPDAGHLNPESLLPDAKAALAWASAQFRSRYGTEMTAPALSGFSNASALFSYVLPRAANLTPAGVAAAAVATKLPVGTLANGGGLDVAAPGRPDAGDNRRAASVIWEWVAPGVRAVVWPKAFATQSLQALTPAR